MEAAEKERLRILVRGTVQGVGFRPFVYNLACSLGLTGRVYNSGEGVYIEIEGVPGALKAFVAELGQNPPPLARIESLQAQTVPTEGGIGFIILKSLGEPGGRVMVPPDVAICGDCRREILDPWDRHFFYPFTNCTNCGPRYTITRTLPYDRARTAMARFPMCAGCAKEYADPRDRRFHAQPVACPACGPRVELVDAMGRPLEGEWPDVLPRVLAEGKIVAVKSLGGFHLACDAKNPEAISALRRRKNRPAKPLAVMFPTLSEAGRYCFVSSEEESALASPQAPIVVLRRRPGCDLPESLSPGLSTLGVMLPYTPLHCLMFSRWQGPLVMTSGNQSGLPLVTGNTEALASLGGIADYFLIHDREIVNRCDDSLGQVTGEKFVLMRRSRGYVPAPLKIPVPGGPDVLGIGAEMKNTLCLLQGEQAYLSQHVGEVDTVEGLHNLKCSLASLANLTGAKPGAVAFDPHPGYRSSGFARGLEGVIHTGVQHHHAHLASAMAENGLTGEVLGIILDGTGYGLDGHIWGFELLRGGYTFFSREAHLAYVPLAGGEQAVRKPWLAALSYLSRLLGEDGATIAHRFLAVPRQDITLMERALSSRVNTPLASSCGRLFDAVSALLGLCLENTYEGQAAVILGDLVIGAAGRLAPYPYVVRGRAIDPGPALAALAGDLERGVDVREIAVRFHDTVVDMVVGVCAGIRATGGPDRVVLSGGSWQNAYLLSTAGRELARLGFKVYTHGQVPAGDGGIALGQAAIARHRLALGTA